MDSAALKVNYFCSCTARYTKNGRDRLLQLAFYYALGINEILLFFGWKSGLSDYYANSKYNIDFYKMFRLLESSEE